MTGGFHRLRRAAGGYPAPVWRLTVGTALHRGVVFWPFTTLNVHVVLGRSPALAGLVLMAQSAAARCSGASGCLSP
ncbi:MAG: hypothetical protein M0Z54_10130 [Thermaerobacter sp.]|nr:hypothetical protein [Thermaerobacter sp.]